MNKEKVPDFLALDIIVKNSIVVAVILYLDQDVLRIFKIYGSVRLYYPSHDLSLLNNRIF